MNTDDTSPQPFWKVKDLAEMTEAEWESLCDGCGLCCLHKLIDDDTNDLHRTRVSCRLLDLKTCRCTHYEDRFRFVADCVDLRPDNLGELVWMPRTCAYRRLMSRRDLPRWHPLVTGDPDGAKRANVAACVHDIVPETEAGDLRDHVVDWWDEEDAGCAREPCACAAGRCRWSSSPISGPGGCPCASTPRPGRWF